jgi:hypothetical protein
MAFLATCTAISILPLLTAYFHPLLAATLEDNGNKSILRVLHQHRPWVCVKGTDLWVGPNPNRLSIHRRYLVVPGMVDNECGALLLAAMCALRDALTYEMSTTSR